MIRRKPGRTQQQTARESVKLDQRQGRGKLIARRQQDRTARERIAAAAKARGAFEIGDTDAAIGVAQEALRNPLADRSRGGFQAAAFS